MLLPSVKNDMRENTGVKRLCFPYQNKHREGEKMKIVIVGCTGNIGRHLLKSLLEKGHEVLAIARHPERIKVKNDNLQVSFLRE